MPDGVTEIGSETFYDCTGLKSATLSAELTQIGTNAFHGCTNLASIDIPDKVELIEYSAFAGCSNLATVSLGKSIKTLEYDCFEDCEKIAEITFPASLQEIEEGAFSGCTALMTINALATTPSELEEEAFDTKQYLRANVYVPRSGSKFTIPSSVREDRVQAISFFENDRVSRNSGIVLGFCDSI